MQVFRQVPTAQYSNWRIRPYFIISLSRRRASEPGQGRRGVGGGGIRKHTAGNRGLKDILKNIFKDMGIPWSGHGPGDSSACLRKNHPGLS
ncbi:hypothetical protein CBFG_00684 [Clostridiales bacterium 1_7_47FAA]|nr:hypothetical protein CBFG_00684 [Clostridiales bacterium 1_7_47FAA]